MKRIRRIGAIPEGYAACEAEAIEYCVSPQQMLGELAVHEVAGDDGDEPYPES